MSDIRNKLIKAVKENRHITSSKWINLEDQPTIQLILETLANPDKIKILNVTLDKPMSVIEILDILEIPQTSGYRKIKSLIENNLLIRSDSFLTSHGSATRKYVSVLEKIKINVDSVKLIVKVKFAKKLLDEFHNKDME